MAWRTEHRSPQPEAQTTPKEASAGKNLPLPLPNQRGRPQRTPIHATISTQRTRPRPASNADNEAQTSKRSSLEPARPALKKIRNETLHRTADQYPATNTSSAMITAAIPAGLGFIASLFEPPYSGNNRRNHAPHSLHRPELPRRHPRIAAEVTREGALITPTRFNRDVSQ